MTVLSITFHTTASMLSQWEIYLNTELHQLIENLYDVDKYLISVVESDRIEEGKNTNVFLVFDSEALRSSFLDNELLNILERVEQKFAQEVMVFVTPLTPTKSRF